jgi:CPA1 family monovalent cation:H+ antiporter
MRGVVTLAAVLTLPEDLEHRTVLILAAMVVVAGTLALQGFTLPALVRLLRVQGPDPGEDALAQASLTQQATAAGDWRPWIRTTGLASRGQPLDEEFCRHE